MRQLLQARSGPHFASVDAGIRGYKARHNLAVIYRDKGLVGEAERQWRETVTEQPDFLPAWMGLGELYLKQERWTNLEEILQKLEADPRFEIDATVLRARGHLARKEFAAARQLLETAVARAPQNIWLRVFLSHTLLQEGKDWAAAEQALRDILALDPDNAEAKHNLAVLLKQQGRAAPQSS